MKRRILKLVGGIVGVLILVITAALTYVKVALPNVGPAPNITLRPEASRIEHGRYLANHVAACMDCHSTRDFSKLTGPMVAGTEGKGGEGFLREAGFPGNYYAPNLTPIHLANWTDGEMLTGMVRLFSQSCHIRITQRWTRKISRTLFRTYEH
jgi:hypothetical protein